MPKFSIVTVAYNSAGTIRQTIESLLGQTYDDFEYIIVDGLSTDGTVDIVRSYAQSFADKKVPYRVISEKDTGIYDAMNKGIRMAAGELIGLINSDDWYEPQALATVSKAYETTPFDVYYTNLRIHVRGMTVIKSSKLDTFPSTRHWNHPTTFIRKSVYDRHLYACERFYADWDLVLRLRKAGYRFVVGQEILANFRYGGISTEKDFRNALKRIAARYDAYRANGYSRLYLFECIAMETAKYLIS